jgi:PAS domain S-box-containing protein
MLGYTREELLTRRFQDLTPVEDLTEDLKLFERLLAGDIASYVVEKRYIRKDGRPIWTNVTISLVRTESGEPKYTIAVVEDTSQHKETEAALRESQGRLRRLVSR